MSQEAFAAGVALFARHQITEHGAWSDFVKEQQRALGSNGAARVDSVRQFLGGLVGREKGQRIMDLLLTADDVAIFEDLQRAVSTQGAVSFHGGGRDRSEPAAPPKSWGEKMWPGGFKPEGDGRAKPHR